MTRFLIFIQGKWCVFDGKDEKPPLRISYRASAIYVITKDELVAYREHPNVPRPDFWKDHLASIPVLREIVLPPSGPRALFQVYASPLHFLDFDSQGYSLEDLFKATEEQMGKFEPALEALKNSWLTARRERRLAQEEESRSNDAFVSGILHGTKE